MEGKYSEHEAALIRKDKGTCLPPQNKIGRGQKQTKQNKTETTENKHYVQTKNESMQQPGAPNPLCESGECRGCRRFSTAGLMWAEGQITPFRRNPRECRLRGRLTLQHRTAWAEGQITPLSCESKQYRSCRRLKSEQPFTLSAQRNLDSRADAASSKQITPWIRWAAQCRAWNNDWPEERNTW